MERGEIILKIDGRSLDTKTLKRLGGKKGEIINVLEKTGITPDYVIKNSPGKDEQLDAALEYVKGQN